MGMSKVKVAYPELQSDRIPEQVSGFVSLTGAVGLVGGAELGGIEHPEVSGERLLEEGLDLRGCPVPEGEIQKPAKAGLVPAREQSLREEPPHGLTQQGLPAADSKEQARR